MEMGRNPDPSVIGIDVRELAQRQMLGLDRVDIHQENLTKQDARGMGGGNDGEDRVGWNG